MRIDLKRLRHDLKRLKANRAASPIGRVKSGATAVIRNNLAELERMKREDGALWTEIAAGLATQGVTEGDGRPISGRRLNKLISNIKNQVEKKKRKDIARGQSASVPDPIRKLDQPGKRTVRLAPEMKRQRDKATADRVVAEDEIRLTELQKHAHLLKKR